LGYGQAARLTDLTPDDGIVHNGKGRPDREVLCKPADGEQVKSGGLRPRGG
jgi:hypothetical protein